MKIGSMVLSDIFHRILFRASGRLSVFLVVLVLISMEGMAADPSNTAGVTSGKIADTSLEVNGIHYANLGEYQSTEVFNESGARCGTDSRLPLGSIVWRAVADCSMSQSDNLADYLLNTTYYIPVWFHVIRKDDGTTGEVSDALIESQIDVMNEDYLAMAGTPGANGVNTRVEFYLAGVSRHNSTVYFDECYYVNCDSADGRNVNEAYKTALRKRTDLFLNIYTKKWPDYTGLLGYATFPQEDAEEVRDGVALSWSNVGRNAPAGGLYDQGRTGTHEVGHYLGLFHTFQSGCGTASSPGCYTSGDLICDTNSEDTAHYGCTASSTCTTADPIENYMNYTSDVCMEEFTTEQAQRARCSLENYRHGLVTVKSVRNSGKIYVDGSYAGEEFGTLAQPFNTVGEAYDLAWNGAELVIKGGIYPENLSMGKQVTLSGQTGTGQVTIGD